MAAVSSPRSAPGPLRGLDVLPNGLRIDPEGACDRLLLLPRPPTTEDLLHFDHLNLAVRHPAAHLPAACVLRTDSEPCLREGGECFWPTSPERGGMLLAKTS